jgi:hypothetical protein
LDGSNKLSFVKLSSTDPILFCNFSNVLNSHVCTLQRPGDRARLHPHCSTLADRKH